MARTLSAGLLLYRRRAGRVEVLLAHMGGPFWARKDLGAWSAPKGEYEPAEDPFAAAKREFAEELGSPAPDAAYLDLGDLTLSGSKSLRLWAAESDFDAESAVSNSFELEWPRGSGRMRSFPEIDRAEWFDVETARTKLTKGQAGCVDRLLAALEPDRQDGDRTPDVP